MSSYLGTWVLSNHDLRAAPQTVQTASPVCGTKNFSSVRLYSAPQLHCTIVAIQANMRFGLSIFQPRFYALATSRSRPTFAGPSNARAAVRAPQQMVTNRLPLRVKSAVSAVYRPLPVFPIN